MKTCLLSLTRLVVPALELEVPALEQIIPAYIKILEYKSQNSDKCAALTNHLSLLIKRNLQFFDILSSPIPGIKPGTLGWKPGVLATILSRIDRNV